MHPEHAEHYATAKTIRLRADVMAHAVVIVRVGRITKWRLHAAFWLMKVAGRIGGFKSVRLERSK